MSAAASNPTPLPQILDLLSEFLALKDAAVEIYSDACLRAPNTVILNELERKLKQNQRHGDQLRNAIRDLGGNPVYLSPLAQVEQERTEQLRNLKTDERYRQILDFETLLYVESLDQANWSFLKQLLPDVANERVREVLFSIVDEVETQEVLTMLWARRTLAELRRVELVRQTERSPRVA